MHDPPPSPGSADSDPFGQALDELLRAWSSDQEVSRDELLVRYPALGEQVDPLFELAREIAVVRPPLLPSIPGYDVLGEVGRGGMGIVYRARQHGVDRIVALKVLPEAFGVDARARSRFLAEARGLGRIRHAHVVTIHGVIETADVVAYAMEWVDGRSLASLLEDLAGWPRRAPAPAASFGGAGSSRLPDPAVPWFCRLGVALARALGEVHRHGLVHRDVKPGNVLLRADGTPLLSDFGLVRAEAVGLTRTGQVVGTPAFAAPEQLRADADVGPAADVFALGATLHCVFAGQVPFAGRTALELLANIEARRRPSLVTFGLPKDLETIVARCVEPEVGDRYGSADAVAEDLENLLGLRPVNARPLGALQRCWRLVRRNRRLVVASLLSALLVLAASVACGLWLWSLVTLPERFQERLLAARFALLEPTHEERIELAKMGKHPERPSVFEASGQEALDAYAAALALDGSRRDVALERDVVALAQSMLQKRGPAPSATLRASTPQASAAALAWHEGRDVPMAEIERASAEDLRALGLLAFLTGRANECHAAWRELEMSGDAFLDAAAGQMHLQRGDVTKAAMRLSRAAQTWPEAGFLAVALADCAVRAGDLDVAERELDRAERLERRDPFSTHKRVRADLRAAQGRFDEARDLYEWVIARHFADTARINYIAMLERRGDLGKALDLRMERFRRGSDENVVALACACWNWWKAQTLRQRVDELSEVFVKGSEGRLRQVVRFCVGPARGLLESGTLRPPRASLEVHEAALGLAYLMEITQMMASKQVSIPAMPGFLKRGLGAALGVVSGRATGRSIMHATLSRVAARATCVAMALMACFAKAQTFSDGGFVGWSSQVFLNNTGSGSSAFPAVGGNPGACSRTTTTHVGSATTPGVAWVGKWSPIAVWDPAIDGPIKSTSMTIDARFVSWSQQGGCAFYSFAYQGGSYFAGPGVAIYPGAVPTSWPAYQALALGTGGQGQWSRMTNPFIWGAPPVRPDFSSTGAPILFGVMVGHTSGPPPAAGAIYTATADVDNWSVTITPAGLFSTFGQGCPGSIGTPSIGNNGLPWLGNQNFGINLQSGLAPSFAALVLSTSTQTLPGASVGAPGCDLLVGFDHVQIAMTTGAGTAALPVPIPNALALVNFTFHGQWLVYDPTVNALGFVTSNAATATIE